MSVRQFVIVLVSFFILAFPLIIAEGAETINLKVVAYFKTNADQTPYTDGKATLIGKCYSSYYVEKEIKREDIPIGTNGKVEFSLTNMPLWFSGTVFLSVESNSGKNLEIIYNSCAIIPEQAFRIYYNAPFIDKDTLYLYSNGEIGTIDKPDDKIMIETKAPTLAIEESVVKGVLSITFKDYTAYTIPKYILDFGTVDGRLVKTEIKDYYDRPLQIMNDCTLTAWLEKLGQKEGKNIPSQLHAATKQ